MKKIGFITLGCKVNIYESNAIKEEFQKRGYETVEAEDLCDAYIINTCIIQCHMHVQLNLFLRVSKCSIFLK